MFFLQFMRVMPEFIFNYMIVFLVLTLSSKAIFLFVLREFRYIISFWIILRIRKVFTALGLPLTVVKSPQFLKLGKKLWVFWFLSEKLGG